MLLKNIFFSLWFLCLLHVHVLPSSTWQSTYHLGTYGFASITHIGIPSDPFYFFKNEAYFEVEDFKNLVSGDIIRIMPRFVARFYHEVLPRLSNPVVLLISGGDECFPSDCNLGNLVEDFLGNDKIIHIFSQNCDYSGPSSKVSPYPIGLDFHSIAYKNHSNSWKEKGSPLIQEKTLNRILKQLLPTYQRKIRAFVDFQWSDNMHGSFNRYLQFGEDRASIFKQLLSSGLIDHGPKMRRSALWKTKGTYAFSISPPGNGLDCHRTWEDLVLGCIVIVKTSPLDPLYENLPVVIINDWSEITEENLNKWLKKFPDAFSNPEYRERLTNSYWLNKITSASEQFKLRH